MDFGDFRIRKYRRENQNILAFSGAAGSNLARELERLAARCRGDVGLDLSELEGITPQLVPVLERVRKRLAAGKRSLFLCNPPSKLLDALSLAGVTEMYALLSATGKLAPLASVGLEVPPAQALAVAAPSIEEAVAVGEAAAAGGAARAARKEIAQFDRSLKRNEVLERGLESAARCVQKLLPVEPPSIPGYGFAFTYRQSEKVGGDFFDFIPLENGCLGISIGDVSGRGMEAAILMCLAKKVIAIRAQDPADKTPSLPREVLSRANQDLRQDLDRTAFITAIYAVLDTRAGMLRFARAGHERPIWFAPAAGGEPRPLASEGTALGVIPGDGFRRKLEESLVELTPGARLLLYTDGLIDAQGPRRTAFSRPRLLDVLRRIRPEHGPADILDALFDEISRHTGGGLPEDDMTALVIARD